MKDVMGGKSFSQNFIYIINYSRLLVELGWFQLHCAFGAVIIGTVFIHWVSYILEKWIESVNFLSCNKDFQRVLICCTRGIDCIKVHNIFSKIYTEPLQCFHHHQFCCCCIVSGNWSWLRLSNEKKEHFSLVQKFMSLDNWVPWELWTFQICKAAGISMATELSPLVNVIVCFVIHSVKIWFWWCCLRPSADSWTESLCLRWLPM